MADYTGVTTSALPTSAVKGAFLGGVATPNLNNLLATAYLAPQGSGGSTTTTAGRPQTGQLYPRGVR
jgi:hypothetical protein